MLKLAKIFGLLLIAPVFHSSHAAMVDPSIELVTIVQPSVSVTETFSVNDTGVYEATVTDFGIQDVNIPELGFLFFSIATSTDLLGATLESGSFTFDAEPGITYFLSLLATADDSVLPFGLVGANVNLLEGTTAVPVPAAAILLASALAATTLFGTRRPPPTVAA